MSKPKDMEKDQIKDAIRLKPEHIILEMGCGTGEFATRTAKKTKKS